MGASRRYATLHLLTLSQNGRGRGVIDSFRPEPAVPANPKCSSPKCIRHAVATRVLLREVTMKQVGMQAQEQCGIFLQSALWANDSMSHLCRARDTSSSCDGCRRLAMSSPNAVTLVTLVQLPTLSRARSRAEGFRECGLGGVASLGFRGVTEGAP